MRTILFTGKGGVGKTTVAASTAALAAERGARTLLLSVDPGRSLADVLGMPVGPEPVVVAGPSSPGAAGPLSAQQLCVQRSFERDWGEFSHQLQQAADAVGSAIPASAELTVIPGAAEILMLCAVRDAVRSRSWDLVVVDCPASSAMIPALALPETLRWYLMRMAPREQGPTDSLRALLAAATGLPAIGERLLVAAGWAYEQLDTVRTVLIDPGTSVRLVLTPEKVVLAETRRTFTALALYGHRVDGVLVNRVAPMDPAGPRVAEPGSALDALGTIRATFDPLPVHVAPQRSVEPVGRAELTALATAMYGADDGVLDDLLTPPPVASPMTVERDGGEFVLQVAVPFADRSSVDLARSGDDLVLTVCGHRRVLPLPSVLRRCTITTASLRQSVLHVRFTRNPDLWPRSLVDNSQEAV